jgi:hypothetical protein
MTRRLRHRFFAEADAAFVTGLLAVLTVMHHDWLERLGVDVDHGSGAAEWLLVGVLAAACVLMSGFAQLEWRRAATA